MKRLLVLIILLVLTHTSLRLTEAWGEPTVVPGQKLIVGIEQDPPYTFRNEQGQWTGLNVDLWHYIAQDLKLAYTFKEMGPEELLAALQRGTIDVTVSALFVTAEHEQQFELTTPFGSTRLAVATLLDAEDHPWLAALKIFFSWGTLQILLGLMTVLCVLGFLFWLIERTGNPEHFGKGVLGGIGAGIYWVGSTLASGVCFGISLKSVTGRILGLIWMLVCALALSAFIASLTSSLTTRHISSNTYDGDKLRNMHLGSEAGTLPALLIEKMGGRITLFRDEEDALRALLDRKIDGFFYDEVTLHYYAERTYRGTLSIHPTNLKEPTLAFGMPRNSPLRKAMNVSMLRILEEPVWESILSRYGLEKNFEAKPFLLGREKKGRRDTRTNQ